MLLSSNKQKEIHIKETIDLKKLLMLMICAALLLSVSGMAELKLGDCAVVANCNAYISLRSNPSKNAQVLERIHLNDEVFFAFGI